MKYVLFLRGVHSKLKRGSGHADLPFLVKHILGLWHATFRQLRVTRRRGDRHPFSFFSFESKLKEKQSKKAVQSTCTLAKTERNDSESGSICSWHGARIEGRLAYLHYVSSFFFSFFHRVTLQATIMCHLFRLRCERAQLVAWLFLFLAMPVCGVVILPREHPPFLPSSISFSSRIYKALLATAYAY